MLDGGGGGGLFGGGGGGGGGGGVEVDADGVVPLEESSPPQAIKPAAAVPATTLKQKSAFAALRNRMFIDCLLPAAHAKTSARAKDPK